MQPAVQISDSAISDSKTLDLCKPCFTPYVLDSMQGRCSLGLLLPILYLLLWSPMLAQSEAASPSATKYLDAALKVMQEHFLHTSLHTSKIDWPRLRQEAFVQAGAAQTAVDTYPAIRFALARLGDHHSYLQLTAGAHGPRAGAAAKAFKSLCFAAGTS
jgi:hypothetical protein